MKNVVIKDRAFMPVVGECFEISFGEIEHQGKKGEWGARVRIDGENKSDWIDLDTGRPLDANLAIYVVRGYREINCDP